MYDMNFDISIIGQGFAHGSKRLTNQDVIDDFGIKMRPSFIEKNIGSKVRYFLDDEQSCSDLAVAAAQQALSNAKCDIQQVDRLIVATSTPDFHSPSTACVVQNKLGGSGFPAYDVAAACSGFVYALDQAIRYVATGDKHVLVIGVDVRSRTLDKTNKRTAFLYGDGAGAVVISRLEKSDNKEAGFLASFLYADGAGYDAVTVPAVGSPPSLKDKYGLLAMPNGRRVSENASKGIPYLCERVLDKTAYSLEDIDMFLFHQPNFFMLQAVKEQLQIPDEKIIVNFPEFGNTVSASIPIALCQAFNEDKLKPGMLVLLCAVGAGFTGGAHLLRWTGGQ